MATETLLNKPNIRRLLPALAAWGALLLFGAGAYWPAGERVLSNEELVEPALTSGDEVVKIRWCWNITISFGNRFEIPNFRRDLFA